jgi:branched-chain amino acid transport system ATP-binding protein
MTTSQLETIQSEAAAEAEAELIADEKDGKL